jgi:hypothetical protein
MRVVKPMSIASRTQFGLTVLSVARADRCSSQSTHKQTLKKKYPELDPDSLISSMHIRPQPLDKVVYSTCRRIFFLDGERSEPLFSPLPAPCDRGGDVVVVVGVVFVVGAGT